MIIENILKALGQVPTESTKHMSEAERRSGCSHMLCGLGQLAKQDGCAAAWASEWIIDNAAFVAQWNHLHQPGDITQEFAAAVREHDNVNLFNGDGEWILHFNDATAVQCGCAVATIQQTLLILHAYGIEVEWPRKEYP